MDKFLVKRKADNLYLSGTGRKGLLWARFKGQAMVLTEESKTVQRVLSEGDSSLYYLVRHVDKRYFVIRNRVTGYYLRNLTGPFYIWNIEREKAKVFEQSHQELETLNRYFIHELDEVEPLYLSNA